MQVEPYTYRSGLQGIRITVEDEYFPWVLTLHQARDLYTQLTPILEQIANEEREEELA